MTGVKESVQVRATDLRVFWKGKSPVHLHFLMLVLIIYNFFLLSQSEDKETQYIPAWKYLSLVGLVVIGIGILCLVLWILQKM